MLAFVTTPIKWTPPSEPRWEPQITLLDKLKGAALIATLIAMLVTFAMAVEWWDTRLPHLCIARRVRARSHFRANTRRARLPTPSGSKRRPQAEDDGG
jgi:hypothetical protein